MKVQSRKVLGGSIFVPSSFPFLPHQLSCLGADFPVHATAFIPSITCYDDLHSFASAPSLAAVASDGAFAHFDLRCIVWRPVARIQRMCKGSTCVLGAPIFSIDVIRYAKIPIVIGERLLFVRPVRAVRCSCSNQCSTPSSAHAMDLSA